MLIVRTILSFKEGRMGLYAAQDILTNQIVIRAESVLDRWFYHQQVESDGLINFFSRYALYDEERASWHLFGDNARFINQSRTPTIEKNGLHFYALTKIIEGQEITLDYTKTCDWVRRFGLKVKFNGQKILSGSQPPAMVGKNHT